MFNLEVQPSTEEVLKKAKSALTPEQYSRLEKKTLERVNILKLASMNLDELKKELPTIVAGDPEEDDIMTRLNREFPGIKRGINSVSRVQTNHLLDYTKQKVAGFGNWVYEKLPGTDWKKAREIAKGGASITAVLATAVAGESVGKTVQSGEKMLSWIDRFKSNPFAWFKELFDILFSGDIKRIYAFFSSTADSLGVTSSIAEKFAESFGFPKDFIGVAKGIFQNDSFGKLKYADILTVWEKLQKNPGLNIVGELGLKNEKNPDMKKLLMGIFGKDGEGVFDKFKNTRKVSDLSQVPMIDIIQGIVSS